ncbi:MAG: hypothetical protein M3445_08235 [Actinomycetota bacterium]|nr:hypothetical protein [Actinomycetota bacterium]
MRTSPYEAPSWDDADYELLGQDPLPETPPAVDEPGFDDRDDEASYPDEVQHSYGSGSGSSWPASSSFDADLDDDRETLRRSTEYAAMPGMPGRGVVLVTGLVTAGVVGLDFALTGGLSIFFDLCFVVICLVAAMGVRRHDIFATGVLPPLAYAAAVGAVALIAPTAIIDSAGLSKTFMTGLAGHAATLVASYGVVLLTVGGRVAATRRR